MTDRIRDRPHQAPNIPTAHELLAEKVNTDTDLRLIDSIDVLIKHAGDANPGRNRYRQMKTHFTKVGELLNHPEHDLRSHYHVPKELTQHLKSLGYHFPNPAKENPAEDEIGM